MMKKYCVALLALFSIFSCSKFHVIKEIDKGSALSKLKNSGIIFRITSDTPIKKDKFNKSLSQWIEPYQKKNNLKIITAASSNLSSCKSQYDRLLQTADNDDFIYYKSIGIITQYLNNNKEELGKIIADNNLDSLIIYEVNGAMSSELQYHDFNSMIVIVNAEYKILYMDHQTDHYDSDEYDADLIKNYQLDQINNRLLELLFKLNYLKKV